MKKEKKIKRSYKEKLLLTAIESKRRDFLTKRDERGSDDFSKSRVTTSYFYTTKRRWRLWEKGEIRRLWEKGEGQRLLEKGGKSGVCVVGGWGQLCVRERDKSWGNWKIEGRGAGGCGRMEGNREGELGKVVEKIIKIRVFFFNFTDIFYIL